MTISIVVPVYNVENYIRECLDSISKQEYIDFECVLVDDGSTDSSGDICDEYARKDRRFCVVHKPNEGVVLTRKVGVNRASGEYICFVDSDDYIGPCYIKRFAEIVERYNPDLISNNYMEHFCGNKKSLFCLDYYNGFYEGDKLEYIKSKLIYDTETKGFNTGVFLPSLWLKCIKKELLAEQYESCDESISMGEDAMISFPLAMLCNSIYITCFDGYFYRKNPDSIVNSFNPNRIDMLGRLSSYLRYKMPAYKMQIDVFFVYRLYDEIICAGKSASSISEYKAFLSEKISKDATDEFKILSEQSFDFKKRLGVFLMRKRLWGILFFIIKLRF